MRIPSLVLAAVVCASTPGFAQQAHVNLDWNPHKNTENLTPFGANVISPEVRDDRTVTFRVKAADARTVALTGGPCCSPSARVIRRSPSKRGRRRLDADGRAGQAEHVRLQIAHRRRRGRGSEQHPHRVLRSAGIQHRRRARRRPGVLRRQERSPRRRHAARLPLGRAERRAGIYVYTPPSYDRNRRTRSSICSAAAANSPRRGTSTAAPASSSTT